MKKNHFLLFLLCMFFAAPSALAQDTLYYRFYKGVQMIEIRPDKSSSPPVFLFRNDQGKVVAQHNTCGLEVIFSSLKPVQALKGKLQAHKAHTLHEGKTKHRYAFGTLTGFYLVYACREGSEEQRIGIIDSMGVFVLPCRYNVIQIAGKGYIVSENKKFGFIDQHFNIAVPVEYDRMMPDAYRKDLFQVVRNGKAGLVTYSGKTIVPCTYQEIKASVNNPGCFDVSENDRWGLVVEQNKIKVPLSYDQPVSSLHQGFYLVRSGGLSAFVDSAGHQVCGARYNQLTYFEKGRWWTRGKREKLYVLMNREGKELCVSPYEVIEPVSENRFVVRNKKKYGLVDRTGKIMVPINFYTMQIAGVNVLNVCLRKRERKYGSNHVRWTLIDTNGRRILRRTYRGLGAANGQLFIAKKHGRYGFIDAKGKTKVSFIYTNAFAVSRSQYRVFVERKAGLLNLCDLSQPTPLFDEVLSFSDGMAVVKQGNLYGYIDTTGRLVVPVQYKGATLFQNGMCAVSLAPKWRILNRKGENIFDEYFDHVQALKTGNFLVTQAGVQYLVRENGEKVPLEYETEITAYSDFLRVKMQGRYGIVREAGHTIVPFEYDEISEEGIWYRVKKNGKYGYYDREGKMRIPVMYDALYSPEKQNLSFIYASKNGKWGLIDIENKVLYPFIFEKCSIGSYGEHGLVLVKRKTTEEWRITQQGELEQVIVKQNPSFGFSIFRQEQGCGLLNWEGDTLVKPVYASMVILGPNCFRVGSKQSLYGLVDSTGKTMVPADYNEVEYTGGELMQVRKGDRWGLYQAGKKEICAPVYHRFMNIKSELILFRSGGVLAENKRDYTGIQMGVMNREGKILIPALYDYVWYGDKEYVVVSRGEAMAVVNMDGKIAAEFEPCKSPVERWNRFKLR